MDKKQLIQQIEGLRKSRVITYLTSDRPGPVNAAATMIALGADEIVMSDLSELSPIDPSTANIFNPQDPHNPQNKIPISVEDVMAYFDLARNKSLLEIIR